MVLHDNYLIKEDWKISRKAGILEFFFSLIISIIKGTAVQNSENKVH